MLRNPRFGRSIALGLALLPILFIFHGSAGAAPQAARIPIDKLRQEFDEIKRSVRFVVEHMPAHGSYIANYCPANAA